VIKKNSQNSAVHGKFKLGALEQLDPPDRGGKFNADPDPYKLLYKDFSQFIYIFFRKYPIVNFRHHLKYLEVRIVNIS
jgi:hypothetical protein